MGSRGSCKLNTRGMKNWHFSTDILLNFENGHSYNGKRIGARMRSIKWCYFQLCSMAPNLDFKVTVF